VAVAFTDFHEPSTPRRLAVTQDNFDPKKTPEVMALGSALLQQAVNSPEDGKWWGAPMSLTPLIPRAAGLYQAGPLLDTLRAMSSALI
jgi:hypothetical protein